MVKALAIGDLAPDFSLPAAGAERLGLKDFRGKKLVLFFYPKADTPGCTQESIDFSQLKPAFAEAGTEVAGASADPVKAQLKFQEKHALSLPLICDESHAMLEAYGVWAEKSMYGKTYMGVERTTFLIDREGRIARIWHKVKVPGHAKEALATARSL